MNEFKRQVPIQQRLTACFYCDGLLPASKKEHIFNSNWTGKHKTGSLICDECNSAFSKDVDSAFKPYTKYPMNVWSLKGERQKVPPTIETQGEIIIKPGAQPEIVPSIDFRLKKGGVFLKGKAPNKSALRRLLKDRFHKNLGEELNEYETQKINDMVRASKVYTEQVESVYMYDSINPQFEIRSTVHTVLKCMAFYDYKFNAHISREVLNFSRYGTGEWSSFSVVARCNLDLVNDYSKNHTDFNAVEVHYLPSTKQILARHIILGVINRWVVISSDYEGPPQVLFVAEQSLGGKLEPLLVSYSDIDHPSAEFERCSVPEDFMGDLKMLSQIALGPDAQLVHLLRFIDETFKGHTYFTQELINEYKEELLLFSSNMVRLTSKIINYSIPYSKEEMLNGFRKNGFFELEQLVGQSIVDPKNVAINAAIIVQPISFLFAYLEEKLVEGQTT